MMMFSRPNLRDLSKIILSGRRSVFCPAHGGGGDRGRINALRGRFPNLRVKWRREQFYECFDFIHDLNKLQPVILLKNRIARDPDGCISIAEVSRRKVELKVRGPTRVAVFLRRFPSVFEQFTRAENGVRWFRLTREAAVLHEEEKAAYEARKADIVDRLRRLILMSVEKQLPLKVIKELTWYLGLPHDFCEDPLAHLDGSFVLRPMDDETVLAVADPREGRVLSALQRNAIRLGVFSTASDEFPLFPAVVLKWKIREWLRRFQRLPYVSPYDCLLVNPRSMAGEKRVVGVAHELLALFVDHFARRRPLLHLREHLRLPVQFKHVFERHPHIFYISRRNRVITVILKEAYRTASNIEPHPLAAVRRKYVRLMNESELILRDRRRDPNRRGMEMADQNLKVGGCRKTS